jgi:hypothetical protein
MDDLSRVVSFFVLCREEIGNDGNIILGFRGPRALDFEFSVVEFARVRAADELDARLAVSAAF